LAPFCLVQRNFGNRKALLYNIPKIKRLVLEYNMSYPISVDSPLEQCMKSLAHKPNSGSTWRERIAHSWKSLKDYCHAWQPRCEQKETYSLAKVETQLAVAGNTQKSIMDYAGIAGNIYGKTAKEVQDYMQHERDSWGR
jgi:hypothetical protein